MTWDVAINNFYSEIMQAFPSNADLDGVELDYLTYDLGYGSFDETIRNNVKMYINTSSEVKANEKVMLLSKKIPRSGVQIPCDGGSIWIKRGKPWCQNIPVQDSEAKRYIKVRNFNVEYQFHINEG